MNNSGRNWLQLWSTGLAILIAVQLTVVSSSSDMEDWSENVDKHVRWERHVRARASLERHRRNAGVHYIDDTAHIVDIQDYYRSVFSEGWEEPQGEKEKYELLNSLEAIIQQEDSGRAVAQDAVRLGAHSKPIKGRYIVMFQSDAAGDYLLDRTMAIMQRAHRQSQGRIRASDMHALRHVGKGFTATLNSKAVELVRHNYKYNVRTSLLSQLRYHK